MARTLTNMVLDLTVGEKRSDPFGGLRWGANRGDFEWRRLANGFPTVWDEGLVEQFGDRVVLKPTGFFNETYTVGSSYFGTYLRTVPQLKEWLDIELLYSEPTGTTVRFLLVDEDGDEYAWDGAAWVAADPTVTADWNTNAEIRAGFPSWTGTTVGVLFRLETTVTTATPVVYGARAMIGVWLPSAEEDLIHRTLIPYLSQARPSARIVALADGTDEINLSELQEYRLADEDGVSVLTVVAAYNITDEPTENTDLLSSWAPATSLVTLTSAQTTGDHILLELELTPIVARATHADYIELARLPALTIEQILLPRQQLTATKARTLVRDTVNGDALQIAAPEQFLATFTVRAVAQLDVDLQRLIASVAVLETSAPSAQSEVTGEWAYVARLGEWSVENGGLSASASWELRGTMIHRGQASTEPLLVTVTPSTEEMAAE